MIYFISGHRDLTIEEFKKHYIPKIDEVCAFDKNAKFVVGDYWGADTFAQDYLVNIGYGDNVTVYAGAKILGDVRVGNNVIVAANAVVVKDVEDNCIVGGIPAKVIKRI